MRQEIDKETARRWAEALQTAHDFLRDNMQYGDDWNEECEAMEDMLVFLGRIETA